MIRIYITTAVLIGVISIVILALGQLLSHRSAPGTSSTYSSYECGYSISGTVSNDHYIEYLSLGLLYCLLDIEISAILPICIDSSHGSWTAISTSSIFLWLAAISLLYELTSKAII